MPRRTRESKPPLRLPSAIKHTHQGFFLHYMNTETSTVKKRLKSLTKECVGLFGQIPMSFDVINDRFRLGVWYKTQHDESVERSKWWEVSRVYSTCVSPFYRQSYDSYSILSTVDSSFKAVLDYEETLRENVFKFIEGLDEEAIKPYREATYPRYTKPKESIDLTDIQWTAISLLEHHLRETDAEYQAKMEIKWSKLRELYEFQGKFDALMAELLLTKEWLARSAFFAIWDGTGILRTEASYVESISREITLEIDGKLGRAVPDKASDWYLDSINHGGIPKPRPFTYEEDYWIYYPFEHYEGLAVEAYKKHLREYFAVVKETLKANGFAEHRGDQYKYERLKWLVHWNLTQCSKDQLLQKIAVETNNDEIDLSTVNKAFKKFATYELPLRRAKKEMISPSK